MFVHERGARHLVDPSKLMASATRLYGEDMDRLWGAVAAGAGGDASETLSGSERLIGRRPRARGRRRRLDTRRTTSATSIARAASPLSAIRPASGVAPASYVMPPTPPPDIDLEAWRTSADRILSWDPDTLFLTHFGPFRGARTHFQELFERLDAWSAIVRRLLADSSIDDAERERRFVEEGRQDIRRTVGRR